MVFFEEAGPARIHSIFFVSIVRFVYETASRSNVSPLKKLNICLYSEYIALVSFAITPTLTTLYVRVA